MARRNVSKFQKGETIDLTREPTKTCLCPIWGVLLKITEVSLYHETNVPFLKMA